MWQSCIQFFSSIDSQIDKWLDIAGFVAERSETLCWLLKPEVSHVTSAHLSLAKSNHKAMAVSNWLGCIIVLWIMGYHRVPQSMDEQQSNTATPLPHLVS